MTLPNFLIIGAMKAGTTSLYYYLKQHPQIYMSPVKEPNFFALEGRNLDFSGAEGNERINRWIKEQSATSIEEYRALFRGVSSETAIGEASPMYLYTPQAPGRIKHYTPEAQLIVILRNPAERAYSAFLFMSRDGREPLGEFSQALQAEETRIHNNWEWMWHYKNMGFYYDQLKRYFDEFDRRQIKVYLYEDLRSDPLRTLRDLFLFLGVDHTVTPNTTLRHNISGIPKDGVLSRFAFGPNIIKSVLQPLLPEKVRQHISLSVKNRSLVEPPVLASEVYKELIEVYRDDVLKLQDLVGRDLAEWLE
jgi:hypothetical protein